MSEENLYGESAVNNSVDPFAMELGLTGAPFAPKKPQAWGYRIGALLLFVLAVGGLFLGLLGTLVEFFAPVFTGETFGTAIEPALNSSLMGAIIQNFRDIFSFDLATIFGAAEGYSGLISTLLIRVLLLLLTLSVAAMIAPTAVALASPKRAKACMHANAILILASYGGLFFFALCSGGVAASLLETGFTAAMFDIPCAIVAGIALLSLFVVAIIERKATGILNVLLVILSLGSIFMFFYPGAGTALLSAVVFGEETVLSEVNFITISMLIAFAVSAFNAYATCIRACAKKCFLFDAIRFVLQFLVFVLVVIATVVEFPEDRLFLFEGQSLLPAILLLVTSFASALVAVLITVIQLMKKRSPKTSRKTEAPAPAPQTAQTAQPMQTEAVAPVATATLPQEPAPVAVVGTPAPQEAAPASQPYIVPNATTREQEALKSDFVRRMEAIAKDERSSYAPPPPPMPPFERRESETATYEPLPVFKPRSRVAPVPVQSYNSQYTYDPFINTLTPQEKNEFGDLFIAGKYGPHTYLPTYIIGGDNRDFFNKVFIYLGKFRKDISGDLLEKLYAFVSRM